MGDLNNFCCTGRIIQDVETRILGSGRPLRTFTVAVNRLRGSGEDTLFLEVAAFGPQFDRIAPHLKKGKHIYVTGYLRQRRWQGEDGTQRTAFGLVAQSLGFVDSGRAENGSTGPSPAKGEDVVEEGWVPF